MSKFIIDTNFLARILIKDNQEQLDIITKFLENSIDNNDILFVDRSVVFELIYVLSGNIYQLSKYEVKSKILSLIDLDCFTFENYSLILQSLDLFAEYNLDIVDCYLITKAVNENYKLQSFDQKALKVYKKLTSK